MCYTVKVHTLCKSCGKEISSTTNKATSHRIGSNGKCEICGYSSVTKTNPTFTVSPTTVNVKVGSNTTSTVSYYGDGKLTVSSSNSGIATASLSGKTITITGKAKGTTTITVNASETTKYNSASKKITVTVLDNTSAKVNPKLSVSQLAVSDIKAGSSRGVTVSYNGDGKLTATSSNSNVATASLSGSVLTITGKSKGTATITLNAASTSMYNSASVKINVTVVGSSTSNSSTTQVALTGVTLTYDKTTLKVGETANASLMYNPTGATGVVVNKFSSSKTSVASVDSQGKVTAKAVGSALITVTVQQGSLTKIASRTINVVENQISWSPTLTYSTGQTKANALAIGKTAIPTVTINPKIGGYKVTGYKISDTKIATINSLTGVITGKSEGSATVTATITYQGATRSAVRTIYVAGNTTPSSNGGNGSSGGADVDGSGGGDTIDNTPVVINVDVIGKYEGTELAKPTENATIVPSKAMIVVEGTTSSATVTITSIKTSWDDSTNYDTINGNSGMIIVPDSFEAGSEHMLHLVATASNNTTSNKDYFIKMQSNIEVNAEYDGRTLDINEKVEVKNGDPIKLIGSPEEYIHSISYVWDEGTIVTIEGNNFEITVPETLQPGLHKLRVQASSTAGKASVVKTYNIYISGNALHNNSLEVLPWENENHEITQLGIMLRNDSQSTKANKNLYALGENVTYYLDFKNGGGTISEPVRLTLELPLQFEIVDNGGGKVEEQTIIWEYVDGMEAGFSGTKRVVLKYNALSSEDIVAEKIYPLATISVGGNVKDSSAVINLIYINSTTLITNVYDDATGALISVHSPFMYGDAYATTFRPDETITRAEGALVLVRILFGQEAINNATITNRFSDINETYEEAQKAISVATGYGVIIGYNDGTYRPNRIMTRAEFMKILATYLTKNSVENGIDGLQLKDFDKAVKVYNNPVSEYLVNGQIITKHWAIKEVSLLYRLNMTSLSNNELDLRMDKGITRAEVAQLVNFYLLRAPAESSGIVNTGFSDISMNHKLVGDVIEATRAAHTFTITANGKEIGR